MSYSDFFNAVQCRDKTRTKASLEEVGGLAALYRDRSSIPRSDIEYFLWGCDTWMHMKEEYEFVKSIFNYTPDGADMPETLEWFANLLDYSRLNTYAFMIGIGHADRVVKAATFTCPVEFLSDKDHDQINLAKEMAEKLGVTLEMPERKLYANVFAEKLTFKTDPAECLENPVTGKRKFNEKPYKMDSEALYYMRNVSCADSGDKMEVFLTGNPGVDTQILSTLRIKYPPKYVTHSICAKCPDVGGYPWDGDQTNSGERLVKITIHRNPPKRCPLGVFH